MRHEQSPEAVDCQAIGPRWAEEGLQDAHLADRAVGLDWRAPDLVRPRKGYIQNLHVRAHRQPVRAGAVGQQHVEAAVGLEAVDAAGWVMHAGLALVGEIQPPAGVEHEVVHPAKGLAVPVAQDGFDMAARRIEASYAVAVIGDPQAAVRMCRQAVRPAVIFENAGPLARAIDVEDPAVWNIRYVQVAFAIETRPFQKAIHQVPRPVGLAPGRHLRPAHRVGHPREDLRVHTYRWLSVNAPHDQTFAWTWSAPALLLDAGGRRKPHRDFRENDQQQQQHEHDEVKWYGAHHHVAELAVPDALNDEQVDADRR